MLQDAEYQHVAVDLRTDLDVLVPQWARLADRAGAPPFAHPRWVLAWHAAFGAGDVEVLCVEREGALVAAVPLVRRGRTLRAPTNWHTPFFPLLATDVDARWELLEALFHGAAGPVELSFLDARTGDAQDAVTAAVEAGRWSVGRTLARSPIVELDGTFADAERRLSKNRRKGLQRRRRKLEQLGSLEIVSWTGGDDLETHLADLLEVEASGWKGREGTAIASAPDTLSFYRQVVAWGAERGTLRLTSLRVDGRLLAVDLALVEHGAWYSLKAGYDDAHRAYAPGVVLLHALIELAYDEGLERFELLGDEDPLKNEFATSARQLVELQAFPATPAGTAGFAVARALETARPAVRQARKLADASVAQTARVAIELPRLDGLPQLLSTL